MPGVVAGATERLRLSDTVRVRLPKMDALREAGFAIVAVDYRGWGDSTPIVPSEATIDADVRRAWVEMQRRQPDARKRVIYGHSMGGNLTVYVTGSRQEVVLETKATADAKKAGTIDQVANGHASKEETLDAVPHYLFHSQSSAKILLLGTGCG